MSLLPAPLLNQIRQDCPACLDRIHLNNAGAALPPQIVTDTIVDYLQREAKLGGYELAGMEAAVINEFYPAAATLIGAKAHQMAWATSATEAFNLAVSSILWKEGDIILTTKSDYISNQLIFLQLQQRRGVRVEMLPEGLQGYDPEGLKQRLKSGPRPRLLSITHVPTNSGRVQDVITGGQLAREYDLLYIVDACQSVGQLPIDVGEIQCDFLCATTRKYLRGPRGGGLLYVSQRVLDTGMAPLGLDMHSANWTGPSSFTPRVDAKRFETWERSAAIMKGATAAIHYLQQFDQQQLRNHLCRLGGILWEEIAALPHARMVDMPSKGWTSGSTNTAASPLSTGSGLILADFPKLQLDPDQLLQQLRQEGLNVFYSTLAGDQYHFRERGVSWALRASVHYYNTEEEVRRASAILQQYIR